MKTPRCIWMPVFLLACLSLGAQEMTQTLALRSGWNSVWLEVQPTNPAVDAVFTGLPIESVWAFQERLASVDFIEDANAPVWNKNRWRVYVPTNRVESFHNDLSAVYANHAYLIKATNAATLQVRGRPSLRVLDWAADAYTLRGFPVDPSAPPTFKNFFEPSAAHYDAALDKLQTIYRLNANGQWAVVGSTDLMQPGEACWVYTKGASTYQAPLSVRCEAGDGLEYGEVAARLAIVAHNCRDSLESISVNDLFSPQPNALSVSQMDPTNGVQWFPLLASPPAPYVMSLAAGEELKLSLAIRRESFSSPTYATVLELKDGLGTRLLLPVSASKVADSGGSSAGLGGTAKNQAAASSGGSGYVGLWEGNATINAVSEAHSGSLVAATNALVESVVTNLGVVTTNWTGYRRANVSLTPTATGGEFKLRLLLHVDGNGQTRLLKEVIQMWQNGTTTNNSQGYAVAATPGWYVLVTDKTLVSQFNGAVMRDGVPVGRRLSTAAFDFPDNELPLTGNFAVSQSVSGSITVGPNSPTNPFRHKYHPDHDNLNSRYDGTASPAEVYTVKRDFELQFLPPPTNAPPGYGYNRIDGIYRETLTGLHRTNIVVSGPFRLQRVATTAFLNQ